jgi:hypothetical protein
MKQLKFGYLASGTYGLWVGHIFGVANDRDVICGIVSFCMFLEGASDRVIGNQLTFYRSRVRDVLICSCYIE